VKLRRSAALVFAVIALSASAARAEVTPTLVVGGAGDQITPAADDGTVVWARSRSGDAGKYDLLAQVGSATPVKVNPTGTQGFGGSVEGSQVVYQEVSNDGTTSDVELYDLNTATRTDPAAGVNTDKWEWSPSVSGGYILFGRNVFRSPDSPWKVILLNTADGSTVTLDTARNDCACIFPGQVLDGVATWTKCLTTCQAYWYEIGAPNPIHKVANPNGKAQYFPSPGPSGDIYLVRSGTGCGQNTRLLRFDPASRTFLTLSALPSGRDVSTRTYVDVDTGGHEDLYFDELVCSGSFNADIYVDQDADTASGPATRSAAASTGNGSAVRLRVPGAQP
jgi:hypothetical protein